MLSYWAELDKKEENQKSKISNSLPGPLEP